MVFYTFILVIRFALDDRRERLDNIRKQFLFIHIQDVLPRHQKRTTGIILHTSIILIILQLPGHPGLRSSQVHPLRYDEHQPEPFRTGSDVCQQDTQLLFPVLYLRPLPPGILYMVQVINRETAGDGLVVLPTTVPKGGMEGTYRQLLLQFPLPGFKLLLGQLSPSVSLQGIFYLRARSGYQRRIECLVQEFGRTYPNLRFHIMGYSEHSFDGLSETGLMIHHVTPSGIFDRNSR